MCSVAAGFFLNNSNSKNNNNNREKKGFSPKCVLISITHNQLRAILSMNQKFSEVSIRISFIKLPEKTTGFPIILNKI